MSEQLSRFSDIYFLRFNPFYKSHFNFSCCARLFVSRSLSLSLVSQRFFFRFEFVVFVPWKTNSAISKIIIKINDSGIDWFSRIDYHRSTPREHRNLFVYSSPAHHHSRDSATTNWISSDRLQLVHQTRSFLCCYASKDWFMQECTLTSAHGYICTRIDDVNVRRRLCHQQRLLFFSLIARLTTGDLYCIGILRAVSTRVSANI